MKRIGKWCPPHEQESRLGGHIWRVAVLFEMARDLPVFEIPLDHLNIYHRFDSMTLRTFVEHMNSVLEADLDTAIILDEDGEIMDGRHRIMKALLTGAQTIKAVRFEENPKPCRVEDSNR